MTWRLLRSVLMDEVNGEGNDLGGGGEPGAVALDGANTDTTLTPDAGAGEPKGATTEGMLAEIKQGLAVGGGDAVIQTQAEKDAAAAKAAGTTGAPGEPKPGVKPAIGDDKAAADKLAADTLAKKKPEDFKLSDQEKAVLGPKAQARYQELTHYGKVQYERAERVQQENTVLATQHDHMLKTFADNKANPQDLAALLDLNFRIKTGDLEGALQVINSTRADLLKSMGREEPGVDLLADHPDLKERVANQEISRADAIELANNRRANAARQQQNQSQQSQQRQQQSVQQAQQSALSALQKWEAGKIADDIDYEARKAKIEPQITAILNEYPPNLWLPTIQRLYDSVALQKAAAAASGGGVPLRPNGARPGAKTPNTMLDAIRTGLNYSAAG